MIQSERIDELVRYLHGKAWKLLPTGSCREYDIEDLIQEGLLRALKDGKFSREICAFGMFDFVRKQLTGSSSSRRTGVGIVTKVGLEAAPEDVSPSIEHILIVHEQIEIAVGVSLPDKLRDVLELHLLGYTYDEIAEDLGITKYCAGERLYRCRKKLKGAA